MDEETKAEAAVEEPQGDATDWKAQARKWERRAKENAQAAQELDELKAAQLSESERLTKQLADATARADALQAEKDRAEWARAVSKDSGVPLSILSHVAAQSQDELAAIAAEIAAELKPQVVVPNDGTQPAEKPATARDAFRQAMEYFN